VPVCDCDRSLYRLVTHINPVQYFESFIARGKYDSLGSFTNAVELIVPGGN
jgi:hypothetical protein